MYFILIMIIITFVIQVNIYMENMGRHIAWGGGGANLFLKFTYKKVNYHGVGSFPTFLGAYIYICFLNHRIMKTFNFHGVTMIISRFNIACHLDYCNTIDLIVTMQPTSYPGE